LPEKSDSFDNSAKFAARNILQAMQSVKPILGDVALDALINELTVSGLYLNDAHKSYSLNEIQAALKMAFGEASILFIDNIKNALIEGSK
jgi:hypothetical protein